MKISLDNIKNLLAILGPFLILLGLFSASIYFYAFGIRITDYISFGEAFLLFMDNILVIVFSLGVFFLTTFYYSKIVQDPIEALEGTTFKWLAAVQFFMVFLGIALFFFSIVHKYYNWSFSESFITALNILIFPFITIYWQFRILIRNSDKLTDDEKKPAYKKFINGLIIIYFLALSGFMVLAQAKKKILHIIIEEPATLATCYLTDNSITKSSNDTVYLGRTANYIFSIRDLMIKQ